jgi:HPt (histidine-containing phosphotransfer) domain-containing protein
LSVDLDDHFSQPISKEQLKKKLDYWGEGLENDLMNRRRTDLAIDWEHLHQISDGNEAFERELLQIFVADTQVHLNMAEIALSGGNVEGVLRAAHHVKGSSANVGLTEMWAIASQLELQVQQGQFIEAPILLSELAELLETVQAFLDQG